MPYNRSFKSLAMANNVLLQSIIFKYTKKNQNNSFGFKKVSNFSSATKQKSTTQQEKPKTPKNTL